VIGWKLGRNFACKLGNFSFSFIFFRFAVLNYVSGQIFKSVGVFFFSFYIFIIRSKFKFFWFPPVCDWLQNWAELSRVNRLFVFIYLLFNSSYKSLLNIDPYLVCFS
jgi:hypothetical protein